MVHVINMSDRAHQYTQNMPVCSLYNSWQSITVILLSNFMVCEIKILLDGALSHAEVCRNVPGHLYCHMINTQSHDPIPTVT